MKNIITILFLATHTVSHALINISPVFIEFSHKQNAIEVVLDNSESQEKVFEASIKQWKQENGEDVYTDTDEVLVLPAMRKVAPGSRQKFRVIVRKKTDGTTQKPFRLFFREVPHSLKNISPKAALSISFQLVLPVFVNEKNYERKDNIIWTAQYNENSKKILLKLENKGNTFFKFGNLRANEIIKPINPEWRYVLPNTEVSWEIKDSSFIHKILSLNFFELVDQKPVGKTSVVELIKPQKNLAKKQK